MSENLIEDLLRTQPVERLNRMWLQLAEQIETLQLQKKMIEHALKSKPMRRNSPKPNTKIAAIVGVVKASEGGVSPVVIAETLGLSQTTVNNHLARAVYRGLVVKKRRGLYCAVEEELDAALEMEGGDE